MKEVLIIWVLLNVLFVTIMARYGMRRSGIKLKEIIHKIFKKIMG